MQNQNPDEKQNQKQKQDQQKDEKGRQMQGSHQTNLAEGELEDIEESLRNQENKGDLKSRGAGQKSDS